MPHSARCELRTRHSPTRLSVKLASNNSDTGKLTIAAPDHAARRPTRRRLRILIVTILSFSRRPTRRLIVTILSFSRSHTTTARVATRCSRQGPSGPQLPNAVRAVAPPRALAAVLLEDDLLRCHLGPRGRPDAYLMPKTTPSAMHRSLPDLEAAREADLMDRARGGRSVSPSLLESMHRSSVARFRQRHLWPMRVPRRGAPAGVGGRT